MTTAIATKVSPRFSFKIKTEPSYGMSRAYKTFTAEVVYLTDEGVRNPQFDRWGDDAQLGHLADLTIRAQIDIAEGEQSWYGWDVSYANPYSVNLERAEAMVKTLRKIQRYLDKVALTEGSPVDLAQYCIRVGQAIGVSVRTPFGALKENGGTYASGDRWRWLDTDGLRYQLSQKDS